MEVRAVSFAATSVPSGDNRTLGDEDGDVGLTTVSDHSNGPPVIEVTCREVLRILAITVPEPDKDMSSRVGLPSET